MMDDSELFNLTVVELRSLCNERGLETARLRKKQIVELLVDNGVSAIPENLKDRSTPRKSVRTPVKTARTTRISALTPQKNVLDANITLPTNLTPRDARYQRFQQLAKMKETGNSDKENENQEIETESPDEVCERPPEKVNEAPEQQEKEEEFSDAKEDLPDAMDGESAAPHEENKAGDNTSEKDEEVQGANDDTTKENDETSQEVTSNPNPTSEDAMEETEESTKENDDAASASSFTTAASTAASPAEDTTRVDEGDDGCSATPRKSRKRWSTSPVGDYNFARKSDSASTPTTAEDEDMGFPKSSTGASADGSQPSPDTATNKDSPQPPRLTRQRTFTVQTPGAKSTPGLSSTSKVGFKASKTPNFKKIHERNQAKIEDIASYSARRRDRMRQLLSTTREIRTAAATPRDQDQTPRTPLRTAKAVSQMETPASERKILSNKVRSNRRFELLMKSRGLPIDGEPSEDH